MAAIVTGRAQRAQVGGDVCPALAARLDMVDDQALPIAAPRCCAIRPDAAMAITRQDQLTQSLPFRRLVKGIRLFRRRLRHASMNWRGKGHHILAPKRLRPAGTSNRAQIITVNNRYPNRRHLVKPETTTFSENHADTCVSGLIRAFIRCLSPCIYLFKFNPNKIITHKSAGP